MREPTTDAATNGVVGMTVTRTGFWSAVLTAVLATISFGMAVTTPPRSGPFAAPGTAITYPYSDAAQFVPRDFLWMYPAVLMMLAYLVLAACLHEAAAGERKLFGTLGLCFSTVAFALITADYFIQIQTVQPGLLLGEGPSLAALSQYNPHGLFITLENLGFIVTGLSFAFLAGTLGASRVERAARWVLVVSAALVMLTFAGMSAYFGFRLEYLFEVAVISVVWWTLVAAGVLLAISFRGRLAALAADVEPV